ncbi:hypothetical protein ABGB12_14920 [Actinocorallia sp. B10E7]|uniref:hypothetical protein n=1 Tax=Actinocorallia sp. B10E7 TaxID=3153558 RepID=UPI00325C8F63
MSRALVLAAAAGLVLLTGCTSDDKPAASPTPPATATAPSDSPSAPPSAGIPPQTGVSPSQAPAAPSQAPAPITFGSAQQAADHLITAWRKGDRGAALQAAGPNTVEKVFALPAPAVDRVEGCDPGSEAGDPSYAYRCHYLYEGGASHLWINAYAATGWRVENFTQSAD